jgi:DinB superfamily
MATACPICGFNDSTLSPSDALAALRSYPRRYRGVLLRPSNDDADDPVARRGKDGWSALAHAAYAANAMDVIARELRQVLVRDNADVNPPPVEPDTPPRTDSASVDDTLARLTAATDNLVREVDGAKGDQWARTGVTPSGERITALDVARRAVHHGIHHLRAAEKVLQEVVGRPADPDDDDDD